MKRKPIKIDWEALEDAFANQDDSVVSYLDLVNGHVVIEGEGEEDEFEMDESNYGASPGSSFSASTHLRIHPPQADQKIPWMEKFLASGADLDADVAGQLTAALGSDNPAAELSAVLNANPTERDAWYLYRADRLRGRIGRWLEDNDVSVVDGPPWSDQE